MAIENICQHSFGNEDDKRLVSTGCRHEFCCEDDELVVPLLLALDRATCAAVKGKVGGLPFGVSKAHK